MKRSMGTKHGLGTGIIRRAQTPVTRSRCRARPIGLGAWWRPGHRGYGVCPGCAWAPAWVRWFAAVQPNAFHDNAFERALATLALLKARTAGE